MKKLFTSAAIAAAALFAASTASAGEAISFTLNNSTEHHLTHLYISVPETNSWEEDILGADVVDPGEAVEVTIDDGLDGCEYDLRADFSDGESVMVGSENLCEASSITVSE